MWFKVDDGLAFHHKAIKAGNAAMGLWVRAGSYCGQHMTDGFISADVVATMGTTAQANRLVAAKLWLEADDGYQFHDWQEMNPTRAEIEIARKKEANRKKIWRETREIESAKSGNAAGQKHLSAVSPTGVPPSVLRDTTRDTGTGRVSSSSTGSPLVKGGAGGKTTATRIPSDFAATPEMVAWAKTNVPHVDGRVETQKFIDYFTAASGANARKLDWVAAWRLWMRNADDRRGQANGRQQQLPGTPGVSPRAEHMLRR